jgi:hypothetical protein
MEGAPLSLTVDTVSKSSAIASTVARKARSVIRAAHEWNYFYNGLVPKDGRFADPQDYLETVKPTQLNLPGGGLRLGQPIQSWKETLGELKRVSYGTGGGAKKKKDDGGNTSIPTNAPLYIISKHEPALPQSKFSSRFYLKLCIAIRYR